MTTDASGRVKFDGPLLKGTGASYPKIVMAYGNESDYAILDLQRSPLDVSDFDIGGRSLRGDVDVYSFAERGVYRPGETAHLTVMLRDAKIQALEDRPVTLKVQKPNKAVVHTKRFETAPEAVPKLLGAVALAAAVQQISSELSDLIQQVANLAVVFAFIAVCVQHWEALLCLVSWWGSASVRRGDAAFAFSSAAPP